MTEYWVSQARHWCEYCKIYINGSKSSIAFHEQGRKHKEIVELFLKDMRKRNRERKIERQDLDRELAKIERDAAKAYQQQDNAGQRPRQAAGPPPDRAARLAELEAQIAQARHERAFGAGSAAPGPALPPSASTALPAGWKAAHNPDGRAFFTNLKTGAIQWERPTAPAEEDEADAKAAAAAAAAEAEEEAPPAEAAAAAEAPPADAWLRGHTDAGVVYFYNVARGRTEWALPEGEVEWAPPAADGGAPPDADAEAAGAAGADPGEAAAAAEEEAEAEEAAPAIDEATGMGAWTTVDPEEEARAAAAQPVYGYEPVDDPQPIRQHGVDRGIQQPLFKKKQAPKRPRFTGEDGAEVDVLSHLQAHYQVDAGIKAAMEADAAKEAAAAAAAADAASAQPVVFKKRKGGTGGFRRKAADDSLRDL